MVQLSLALYGYPKPSGISVVVFSSPAAKNRSGNCG